MQCESTHCNRARAHNRDFSNLTLNEWKSAQQIQKWSIFLSYHRFSLQNYKIVIKGTIWKAVINSYIFSNQIKVLTTNMSIILFVAKIMNSKWPVNYMYIFKIIYIYNLWYHDMEDFTDFTSTQNFKFENKIIKMQITTMNPDGEFQPPTCLLGKLCIRLQAIQEIPGVCWGKFPGLGIRKNKCYWTWCLPVQMNSIKRLRMLRLLRLAVWAASHAPVECLRSYLDGSM